MATISVTIDGKTYRMACDEGQEGHLAELAQNFDRYIAHLKANFGEIGDHRLSVMAGIMVMDEMTELKATVDALSRQVESLIQENSRLNEERARFDSSLADFINKAANQIENLAARTNSIR